MVTNSSVFDSKNTDFNENRGPRRQSATRDNMMSSYYCSVMMMMMESWSRGPFLILLDAPRASILIQK